MKPYKDLDKDSNILEYEERDDRITVKFKNGEFSNYEYTYISAGRVAIEEMKRLARCGDGLNSFISKNDPKYSRKF
jgi:hypothetical protein